MYPRSLGELGALTAADFETMRPGDWTGQGVDSNLQIDPSQWNPTLSSDPAIIAQVNQMLANGVNPVTGRPTALNMAVLTKGYSWRGAGDISDMGTYIGNAFDLGLTGVRALPDAQRGAITPAGTVQDAPVAPTPPAGWHAGALRGKTGWWAPDGLFYAGETPWTSYNPGTGESINTPTTPTPPPTSGGGGGGTPSTPPATGSPVDSPTMPGTPTLPPGFEGPNNPFPPEGVIPSGTTPGGITDAPAQAGFGGTGMMALLLGGGLLVAALMGHKKR